MDGVEMEGTSDVREVEVLGDWAYVRNHVEKTITPPDDDAPAHRSGYTLAILREEPDGRWRLARDADLVTVDEKSSKPTGRQDVARDGSHKTETRPRRTQSMHTRGTFAPTSEAEASERYERLGPVARTVVREVARAMDLDREEYDERVTPAVVERARDALFASELAVSVGSHEEFDEWAADHDGEVVVLGSEDVDRVAWHAPPFAEAVAATFQEEEDAAVETLRRQAFGRIYRERL